MPGLAAPAATLPMRLDDQHAFLFLTDQNDVFVAEHESSASSVAGNFSDREHQRADINREVHSNHGWIYV